MGLSYDRHPSCTSTACQSFMVRKPIPGTPVMTSSKLQPSAIVLLLLLTLALPSLAQQISFPSGPRSASTCPKNWASQTTIAPSKVVVQPWKGRHHVYAEFQVPAGMFVSDRAKVTMGDLGEFCGGVSEMAAIENSTGNSIGPTTAIARIRTRTALWLMLQGKIGDLNQAANWQLPISG